MKVDLIRVKKSRTDYPIGMVIINNNVNRINVTSRYDFEHRLFRVDVNLKVKKETKK